MTRTLSPRGGLLLAALTGFLALSWEVLWYRAYSIALMARPQAFGVMLGGYLLGLGAGALLAARWCRADETGARLARRLVWTLTAAGAGACVLLPLFARFVTISRSWGSALLLVSIAAMPLGAVLPLIAESVRMHTGRIGRRTAAIYAANIVGATTGTVFTGFVLMNLAGVAWLNTGLALLGTGAAVAVSIWTGAGRALRLAAVALALVAPALHIFAFDQFYERLFFRTGFGVSSRFTEVVENRSGVIGVTADGSLYGSGVYDGIYSTDLREFRRNHIQRAFAIGAFHPAPRRVLMIGLGSGSWASVIADHPDVEQLTIVEINPGYVQLLGRHDAVAGLASHPRVTIDIADGRRWLQRHPDRQFDLIVANTVYHWRANASSLLSVEFLAMIRRHLSPGGVFYFNSTSEGRVHQTAGTTFPYGWRVAHMLVMSDSPITLDYDRMRAQIERYRLGDEPVFDPGRPEDRELVSTVVSGLRLESESRDAMLARVAGLPVITDDNMGTEWRLPPRYR